MTARVTVLVPNYNRPLALARLLRALYEAIDYAQADTRVDVLVVDDFSEADLSIALRQCAKRRNFTFALQKHKCGNAESAFLSALENVHTEYVWLFGNDDDLSVDGIKYVLRVLDSSDPGFLLLNPYLKKEQDKHGLVPIGATSTSVVYGQARNLFFDFGFVTSTTTFSCLIMKTEPVREFHRVHRLTTHAKVYSHTFTIFGALRDHRALFLAPPIVGFTANELRDEREKLRLQAPDGITHYHQTLGLARLIRACSEITGVPIGRFGSSIEDEVDKGLMKVVPNHLSHFLTHFFLDQLHDEQANVLVPRSGFGHLLRPEVEEIGAVIRQFNDDALLRLFSDAIEVFDWEGCSPSWKMHFFRRAQDRLRDLAREKYEDSVRSLPISSPKKIALSDHCVLASLRGADGGQYGTG